MQAGGANRNVLVTGGAGFLGSHLCRRLLDEGDSVICLDNLSSGSRAAINDLAGSSGFVFLHHDVTEPYDVPADFIVNLACPASPTHYGRDPVRTIHTNVLGTIHALDLARRLQVPILQASTSEVYGDPLIHPQTEHYYGHVNPVGPRACYTEGKRCAETIVDCYRRYYGVLTRIVRIFNSYGPGMHGSDGRVVSTFIINALRNKDLPVHGDGAQTRSFCYVDDTIAGLIAMINAADNVTGPVNIGNPEEHTILELAETIKDLSGSRSRIIRCSRPHEDPQRRRPDISLAAAVLRWKPSVPFRDGLSRTIAYYHRLLSGEKRAAIRPSLLVAER